jgi:hypothetical protein
MQSNCLGAAVVIFACLVAQEARTETLAELVKKEEGIEFGVCNLLPRPTTTGKEIYLVVPARFPSPGIWVTRSILLVGVDEGRNVVAMTEVKTLDDVPPREVVSVSCNKNAITIRMSNRMKPSTLSYVWNGNELKRPAKRK